MLNKIGVSLSIDVSRIDKSRIKEVKRKDGSIGKYLDLSTFINISEADQFGTNGFVTQSQTKEERESGKERPPILGNVKVFYKDEPEKQPQQQTNQEWLADLDANTDVPF